MARSRSGGATKFSGFHWAAIRSRSTNASPGCFNTRGRGLVSTVSRSTVPGLPARTPGENSSGEITSGDFSPEVISPGVLLTGAGYGKQTRPHVHRHAGEHQKEPPVDDVGAGA